MQMVVRVVFKSFLLAMMPVLLGLPGFFLLCAAWVFITVRFIIQFAPRAKGQVFRNEILSLLFTWALSILFLLIFYRWPLL